MWTGPLFDAEIAKRMTVERALELCAVREEDLISDWDERDIEHSKREYYYHTESNVVKT